MNSHIHIKCLTLSILNSCHSFCKRWNYGPWQFDFVTLWNYVLKIGSSQTFLFCEKVIWRLLHPCHFCWPRISLKLSENSFWDKKPPMTHWTPPLLSLFGIRPPSNWISEYEMKPFRSQTINIVPSVFYMTDADQINIWSLLHTVSMVLSMSFHPSSSLSLTVWRIQSADPYTILLKIWKG